MVKVLWEVTKLTCLLQSSWPCQQYRHKIIHILLKKTSPEKNKQTNLISEEQSLRNFYNLFKPLYVIGFRNIFTKAHIKTKQNRIETNIWNPTYYKPVLYLIHAPSYSATSTTFLNCILIFSLLLFFSLISLIWYSNHTIWKLPL